MPKHKFAKGNKFAKGGRRPGAGAKPNWFKELCQDLYKKNKLAERAALIAIGADVDAFITEQGEVIPHQARANVQLDAIRYLGENGFGKPAQAVEHSGEMGIDIFGLIREAEEERGLPSSFDD